MIGQNLKLGKSVSNVCKISHQKQRLHDKLYISWQTRWTYNTYCHLLKLCSCYSVWLVEHLNLWIWTVHFCGHSDHYVAGHHLSAHFHSLVSEITTLWSHYHSLSPDAGWLVDLLICMPSALLLSIYQLNFTETTLRHHWLLILACGQL